MGQEAVQSHGKFLIYNGFLSFQVSKFQNWDNVVVSNKFSTATYTAINVQGNINFGINSIGNIIYDISPEYVS